MSNRYKGGIISATPPTTTGGETGVASGAWTLEQQMQAQAAGNWPIQPPPLYIENVFQTWLYTGNGSSQTITNGVNISGKGGMTWIKQRNATRDNLLFDTLRGATQRLFSNLTLAQAADAQSLTAFNSNGFSVGSDSGCNINAGTYASWTFREQAKFFDVVTFTSSASGNKTFNHNLGAVPGCVIIKNTQTSDPWIVYHRSVGDNAYLQLNSTAAQDPLTGAFSATSTTFTISSSLMYNNQNYVAYLYAHNAGGFGLTETENVISCGSYTGGGTPQINLGYEPQWVMVKQATYPANPSNAGAWYIVDNMRTFPLSGSSNALQANLSNGENGWFNANFIVPTATGFNITYPAGSGTEINDTGQTYIYVAIRRGPMATPTTGTSVFAANTRTGTGANTSYSTGIAADLVTSFNRGGGYRFPFVDRLRGLSRQVVSELPNGEGSNTVGVTGIGNTSVSLGVDTSFFYWNESGANYINYAFQRAPGYFDVVCYTGTGSTRTVTHNLAAVPELMFVKRRDDSANWIGGGTLLGVDGYLFLNGTGALDTQPAYWANTLPTSSVFTVETATAVNDTGGTYVAYLFATCPGVSKVGSYTGTGSTQVINCGFAAGARFVLIRATSTTGNWLVWDSARGIVAGNDPYITLNTSAAEVTGTDWVDTAATGFELSNAGGNLANSNGVSYIFLAIA